MITTVQVGEADSPLVPRFAHIDALRAVAALSVLFVHIAAYLARQPDASWLVIQFKRVVLDVFDLGLFGVALFFFISGFVIPFSLIGKNGMAAGGAFWINRMFRLYPPYWLSLLVVIFVEIGFDGGHFDGRQVLANISMLPQLAGIKPISGVYWTLFVEIIFYVLCVALNVFGILGRVRVISGVVLLLCAVTAVPIVLNGIWGTHFPVKYFGFHLSFLFAGALVRQCMLESGVSNRWCMAFVLTLQLAMVPIVAGAVFDVPLGLSSFSWVAVSSAYLAATLVFLGAVKFKRPTNGILLRIGASSYSLYLLHWSVFVVLIAMLPKDSLLSTPLLIILGVVLSLVIADFSYRWVERPSIRIGKNIVAQVFFEAERASTEA
jgi:peptidoglycan/LPS O-acetylase OafA/YrhL